MQRTGGVAGARTSLILGLFLYLTHIMYCNCSCLDRCAERSSIYPALIRGRLSITVYGIADWHTRTVEGSLVVAQGGTIRLGPGPSFLKAVLWPVVFLNGFGCSE